MKKSELIDMFGLSGDSSSNDQLDDLLFCLESDIPNVLETNSKVTCLSSFTTMPIADSAADDMLAASARWAGTSGFSILEKPAPYFANPYRPR